MYKPDTKLFIPVEHPSMKAEKTGMPELPFEARISTFKEVALGYGEEEAVEEAARCLKCPGHYCQQSCPAHVPIPEFIAAVRGREWEEAYRLISEANNLPAVTGRVCAQECQCELNCTRGIKGEPTAIGRLERFVADRHSAHSNAGLTVGEPTGKQVAVIGSGPAGLSCCCDLVSYGHSVTVFESRPFLGGVSVYGIPEFVLPGAVMQKTIQQLRQAGVVFVTEHTVDHPVHLLEEGYEAVFVATGAGKPVPLRVPGTDLEGVCTANDYLTSVNVAHTLSEAKRVAVIGGGNTAIDVCRAAKRMGAEQVTLIYRREECQMPARREEVLHAKEEGIAIMPLTSPVRMNGTKRVESMTCVRNSANSTVGCGHRPEPAAIPGSEFELPVDLVVLALGYTADAFASLDCDEKGIVQVRKNGFATFKDGVFAGGDAVTGAATVVAAMAAGKKAASEMDCFLNSCH